VISDSKEKLSPITIGLHWLVALTIIGLLTIGFYMTNTSSYGLYPIHKSIGVIIFSAVLLRVVWRLKNGWPEPVREYPSWEHRLAVATHWILIISTVVMPISGMLYAGASGHGFGIFGLEIVASNHDPANPAQVIPYNHALEEIAEEVHKIVAIILASAVLLHLVGALKHHVLDKDATLLRMLGKSK